MKDSTLSADEKLNKILERSGKGKAKRGKGKGKTVRAIAEGVGKDKKTTSKSKILAIADAIGTDPPPPLPQPKRRARNKVPAAGPQMKKPAIKLVTIVEEPDKLGVKRKATGPQRRNRRVRSELAEVAAGLVM